MLENPKQELQSVIAKSTQSVAVLGGGSWGTALVKLLSENKRRVHWYVRDRQIGTYIEKHGHNPKYLPAAHLRRKRLRISNDINLVASAADILILAIPAAFLHDELEKIRPLLSQKVIVSAVKGVIPETLQIVGDFLHEDCRVPYDQIAVIAGPSHAEEVAMEKLCYLTIASLNEGHARCIAKMIKTAYVRTKISNDIIGTEYAAMLKNIYALAAGIAHGLGYGDNFQSVLMSNAIREMKRYIRNVHKLKRNINNSAYLGDLLVTGYSTFSRNRTFGNLIGKGYSVQAAQAEMNMIAEGYYAAKSAQLIGKNFSTRTPIIDMAYAVLYEGKNAQKAMIKLSKLMD